MRYADSVCEFTESYENDEQVYLVSGPCFHCARTISVTIPAKALFEYRQGQKIQLAMRMLSPGQREFLISGFCETCFDALFAKKEEDDHDVAGNGDV